VALLSAGLLIFCGPADEAAAYFTRPELDYVFAQVSKEIRENDLRAYEFNVSCFLCCSANVCVPAGDRLVQGQNPAEFIIDVSGGVIFPNNTDTPRRPSELADLFQESSYSIAQV
jgi:hypothetical protein